MWRCVCGQCSLAGTDILDPGRSGKPPVATEAINDLVFMVKRVVLEIFEQQRSELRMDGLRDRSDRLRIDQEEAVEILPWRPPRLCASRLRRRTNRCAGASGVESLPEAQPEAFVNGGLGRDPTSFRITCGRGRTDRKDK